MRQPEIEASRQHQCSVDVEMAGCGFVGRPSQAFLRGKSFSHRWHVQFQRRLSQLRFAGVVRFQAKLTDRRARRNSRNRTLTEFVSISHESGNSPPRHPPPTIFVTNNELRVPAASASTSPSGPQMRLRPTDCRVPTDAPWLAMTTSMQWRAAYSCSRGTSPVYHSSVRKTPLA